MRAAISLALISVPLALGLQSLDYESGGYTRAYSDEISATSAAGGDDVPESSRTPDQAEQPNAASQLPQEGHVEFSLLGVKSSPSLFAIGEAAVPAESNRKESPWPIRTDPNEQYWPGYDSWDSGFSPSKEIETLVSYFKKSKTDAARQEPMPVAHRVPSTKLVDYDSAAA